MIGQANVVDSNSVGKLTNKLNTIIIKEYQDKYAEAMSKIIISNLLEINAKKLVVPASIYGCEFYHKLGYKYKDGRKELNKDKMYIMEKLL